MKNIVVLNSEIENLINQNLKYHIGHKNYLYNDIWVNEMDIKYFNDWEERVIKMIDANIDLDNSMNIEFLKIIHQDLQKMYEVKLEEDYEDLSFCAKYASFNHVTNDESNSAPKTKCSDIFFSPDSHELEIILKRISTLYEIEDFDFYDGKIDPGSKKDELEDLIFYKHEMNEEEIKNIYILAYLSLAMDNHRQMIINIYSYVSKLINVIRKFQEFNEKDTKVIISDLVENSNKLEFDLSKTNLGHLFYNLYEIGIIAKDKTDIKDERTRLKNYLDQANLFYLDKKSYVKVQKMTRAMPVSRDTDSKLVNSEIMFLETLTSKLSLRINALKLILENLKNRGH